MDLVLLFRGTGFFTGRQALFTRRKGKCTVQVWTLYIDLVRAGNKSRVTREQEANCHELTF